MVTSHEPTQPKFQSILELSPEYEDAANKLSVAKQQLDLKKKYEQALAAFDKQKYRKAAAVLEALLAGSPDYRDAAAKLQEARTRAEMAELYKQASQLHQASQWEAVINVFERIAQLDSDFSDPEELLITARQEFEAQKRLSMLESRYHHALLTLDAGNWREAQQSLARIQEEEPGYEDTGRLLARVAAEIAKQESLPTVSEPLDLPQEEQGEIVEDRSARLESHLQERVAAEASPLAVSPREETAADTGPVTKGGENAAWVWAAAEDTNSNTQYSEAQIDRAILDRLMSWPPRRLAVVGWTLALFITIWGVGQDYFLVWMILSLVGGAIGGLATLLALKRTAHLVKYTLGVASAWTIGWIILLLLLGY